MFRLIVLSSIVACAFGGSFKSQNFRLDGRIVGGSDIDISEQPHQVSMEKNGRHSCGGSIISNTFVVTAAHCTDGADVSSMTVRAGTSTKGSGGVLIKVAKIHQHPDFNSIFFENDITVLELAEPLEFTKNIQPISFNFQEPAVGAAALTSGWGALIEGGSSTTQLQAVTVPIVSQAECKIAYGNSFITESMVCAGLPEGGKDACSGDSGGPLVVDGKLVGVVSWGAGCARPGYPGVYSNVPNLAGFVLDVTGPL